MSQWTSERVAELKRLWTDEGLSASQIARMFGHGVSRNSILSKVHRLNLAERAQDNTKTGKARTATFKQRRAPGTPKAPSLPVHEPEPEITHPLHMMDLGPDHCRWPLWNHEEEPTMLFCGRGRRLGAYCLWHARKAYGSQSAVSEVKEGEDAGAKAA